MPALRQCFAHHKKEMTIQTHEMRGIEIENTCHPIQSERPPGSLWHCWVTHTIAASKGAESPCLAAEAWAMSEY